MDKRPVVLVLVPYYLPGSKGGGPIRSVANMVHALGDELDFRVISADRDLGDDKPYAGITRNRWNELGKAKIYYLGHREWWRLWSLIRDTPWDILYLNSFFSRTFSIWPLLIWKFGTRQRGKLLLAPRGEFSAGALELKPVRKRIFLRLAQWLTFYRQVEWHASTEHEASDIQDMFASELVRIAPPLSPSIKVAPDLSAIDNVAYAGLECSRGKQAGFLKAVFISRISRKKNLDFALRVLAGVVGRVEFTIYGPKEDPDYWAECQRIIATLPQNIKVEYMGELPYPKVQEMFSMFHVFLFPTRGENFGHVVIESWLSGCPVIISDQTPWRGLQAKGVGWDLPLGKIHGFVNAVQSFIDMDNPSFEEQSKRSADYGHNIVSDRRPKLANRDMFLSLVAEKCDDVGERAIKAATALERT